MPSSVTQRKDARQQNVIVHSDRLQSLERNRKLSAGAKGSRVPPGDRNGIDGTAIAMASTKRCRFACKAKRRTFMSQRYSARTVSTVNIADVGRRGQDGSVCARRVDGVGLRAVVATAPAFPSSAGR